MSQNCKAANEPTERTQAAYVQEAYHRRMAVKAQYDANDLFHFSFNIPVGEAVHA
jgi:hypothetical protein